MSAPPPTTGLPPIVVIVPIRGHSPRLAGNLASLLKQDRPCRMLLCVTENAEDPATPVIRRLQEQDPRVVHLLAGQASTCCQKNHNLLAGYGYLQDFSGILVFCDSGHFAPREWLGRLVAPLACDRQATVVSGYHQVIVDPGETSLVVIGRAIIALALGLLLRIPAATQPWGGATAIGSGDFGELDIAGLWSEAVVDDVVLAAHLKKHRKKISFAKEAVLHTFIDDRSYRGWNLWLTRQWAYLKAVFPLPWLLLGLAGIMLTVCLFVSTVILLTAWADLYPPALTVAGITANLFFVALALVLRLAHPAPGPLLLWYPVFLLTMGMAGWCHGQTWLSKTIEWAGISYQYGAQGKVRRLRRTARRS